MTKRDHRPDIYCFLDTSAFIQCRFFDEIDWTGVLKAKNVLLLVAPQVTRELDKLKDDHTNGRRRERARKVLRRLSDLGTPARTLEGAEVRSGVRLRRITREPQLERYSGLAPDVSDDRIVASVLEYSAEVAPAQLLSADHGIVLKAQDCDLVASIVDESLMLPDEPDHLVAENEKLRRQIAQLQLREPKLNVTFADQDSPGVLRVELRPVVPPDEVRYAELVAEEEARLPFPRGRDRIEDYAHASSLFIQSSQIQAYREKIPKYLTDYRAFLTELYQLGAEIARSFEIRLVVHNSGTAPAETTLVQVEFPTAILVRPKRGYPRPHTPPRRPDPPKSAFDLGFDLGTDISSFRMPSSLISRPDRDRQAPRPPYIDSLEQHGVRYHAGLVMHNIPMALPSCRVTLSDDWSTGGFQFHVQIHATNLKHPVQKELNVTLRTGVPRNFQEILDATAEWGRKAT